MHKYITILSLFQMFSDAILLSITGKVLLPDFEFVINLGDWPLEKKKGKDALPIVSWFVYKRLCRFVGP